MARRVIFGIVILVVSVFLFAADTPSANTLPSIQHPDFSRKQAFKVERVIDGDTIVVSENDSNQVKVRLIGVDTPETVHPSKPVQEYGKEASRFAANLLKGEQVYLLYEGEKSTFDKYERTLAYVYRAPDGLFVNAEIIRQGYGHAYTVYPFKYLEEFRQLEQFARQAGKGFWGSDAESSTTKPAMPTAKPSTKTQTNTEDITVYVTRTGAKYHRAGCRYLSKSCIPISLKDAKQRYSPCSVCNPPQ